MRRLFLALVLLLPACRRSETAQPAEVRTGKLVTERQDLRRAKLENDDRLVLPNPVAAFPLVIPAGAALKIAFGVTAEGWKSGLAEVEFTVTLRGGAETSVLLRERIARKPIRDANQWHEQTVPLAASAGKSGTLVLEARAISGGAPRDLDAVWTNPRIVVPRHNDVPNLVLISIDTLRADHLGCYGHTRDTSPNIDRMAREGVLFRRAVAPSSWTLPSHASMFTGLYPHRHGATKLGKVARIRPDRPTLAELLWRIGYRTAGFTGGVFVNGGLGFARGFDRYVGAQGAADVRGASFERAAKWIEANRDGAPFFLFLHTYDVHFPFDPPPPYDSLFDPDYRGPFAAAFTAEDYQPFAKDNPELEPRTLEHVVALYDGEIRRMDDDVGKLLGLLDAQGIGANTCIIFTSDHGDEFGEHGDVFHHNAKLYEELVRVPLIVHCPSLFAPRQIDDPVSLVDIMPTILEMAGAPPPADLDGVSLYDGLLGQAVPASRRIVMEVDGSNAKKEGVVAALRSDHYKLIRSGIDGTEKLFDLRQDPEERRDLRGSEPQVVERLAADLDAALRGGVAQNALPPAQTPDAAAQERLRQLGYAE